MKISKLALTGAAFGGFVIAISTVRWFFMFPDMSQWILACAIGGLICVFSYIYNWMLSIQNKIGDLNARVTSFVRWLSKDELKS